MLIGGGSTASGTFFNSTAVCTLETLSLWIDELSTWMICDLMNYPKTCRRRTWPKHWHWHWVANPVLWTQVVKRGRVCTQLHRPAEVFVTTPLFFLSVITTPRKYFRTYPSLWSEYGWRRGIELQPGKGLDLEAKTECRRGAETWECSANNLHWARQGGAVWLYFVIWMFLVFSLFIISLFQGEEDHNLLFHSVKSSNKQAFDVVLKRSDVSWQNDKGTLREE